MNKIKRWWLVRLHNNRAKNVWWTYRRWSNYPIRDRHELYLSNVAIPRAEEELNQIRRKLGLCEVEMVSFKWYEKSGPEFFDGKQLHWNWQDILL